jgi:hypothetical protein
MIRRRAHRNLFLVATVFLFLSAASHAQILGPAPATAQGNDAATATDYAVFTISAEPARNPSTFKAAPMETSPTATLTIQCSEVRKHRKVDLFFDPAAESNMKLRTFDTGAGAIPNPTVKIVLDMDGAKTFKLVWERMPSGEYHYMNPGATSNLLSPLFLMQWMYSTRITRVRVAGLPSVYEFHVSNLITEAYKSPLCKP